MSKLINNLLAMAAASAMPIGVDHTLFPHRRPAPKVFKGETPKCKTCKYFRTAYKCDSPMKMACEKYARRKKK